MTQQSVQAQRRQEAQRRVDLRLARLPDELERHEQHQCARERRPRGRARVAADRRRAARVPTPASSDGSRKPTRSEPVSAIDAAISQK